jgi:glycosyltransferase involved in cell wall biosynthesis
MHILLVHQNFASLDEPGGTRHHELARYLVEKGHRVTVITSPVSYLTGAAASGNHAAASDNGKSTGITMIRPYVYPAFHRSFVHRLASFFSFMLSSFLAGLRVPEIDLVWGTSPPIFQGVTGWALARFKRVPFVFEVRDLWPAFAVAVGVLRQPVLVKASEWLERFLYRMADQVVINSPGFLSHVKASGARRVEIIPNGADPRMFDPEADGDEFRKQHNLTGKYVVLYAGAHGLSNDLEVVLESAQLLSDRPEIRIVLLGDGKEKPSLVAAAAEMGLTNLCFLPPVPKTGMHTALAAADACIAILKPIMMYETVYPNKVFDYMAAGRPVILAIGGVIRQVIEDAQAGLYVAPGDSSAMAEAILQLYEEPQAGVDMGCRGRRYVEEHFDRAILAGKLENLFVKTLNRQLM